VVFYRGFLRKAGCRTWCFDGELWCYAWLAWYLNSHNLSAEKYATFFKFILGCMGEGICTISRGDGGRGFP
jgi:hypothetical protein